MEKLLDENGGEWMVGKAFTWADLYIAVVLQQVSMDSMLRSWTGVTKFLKFQWAKKILKMDFESPKLTDLCKRVYNIPKMKSYIDNRHDRPFWAC